MSSVVIFPLEDNIRVRAPLVCTGPDLFRIMHRLMNVYLVALQISAEMKRDTTIVYCADKAADVLPIDVFAMPCRQSL